MVAPVMSGHPHVFLIFFFFKRSFINMLPSDCCVTWKVGLDLTNLACSATFIRRLVEDKRQRVTGIGE